MLKLGKEFQPVNYDTTVSSTALVFSRFILLEWLRRKNNDVKTMGELFFVCCEDIRDIELTEALEDILNIFIEGLEDGSVQINDSVRRKLLDWYVSQPAFIKRLCVHLLEDAGLLIEDHKCSNMSISA